MSTSLYLKRLTFNQKLKNSLFARYLTNFRLLILVLIGIIALGVQAYATIPRKLNPSIKIPLVIVSTILPGGSPNDIESLISVPIEDAVTGIDNVKKVTSTSRESASIVTVEFESGIDPEKAKTDIESAVSGISDLPEDALTPNIDKLDFENQPIWVFTLVSKSNDKASLIRFARNLRQELEDLPTIDRASITGMDEQEIQVILKPESVSSYNINPQILMGSIKTSLSSFPAGIIKTENSVFSLSIEKGITNIDDIREQKINVGGQIVSIGDVAQVVEVSKPEQNQSYILRGDTINPSVTFNVFRVTTSNIEESNADAKKLVEDKIKLEGENYSIYTISNASEVLDEEFGNLIRDVVITITLVFFVLLVFLGIRQAFISMLSVPLTFLITFFVMKLTHIEFSFLATFSLLLSLGLLVDDTIVVISAMTSYFRTKKFTPLETGLLVFRDFRVVILTTTITTVWAFIPLILGTGIIGEFIKPIPIVVSSALIGSIFVALFITLPLMVFLLKPKLPLRVKILFIILLFAILLIILFKVVLPQSNLVLIQILALAIFIFITMQVKDKLIASLSRRMKLTQKQKDAFRQALNNGLFNFRTIENRYYTILERILLSKRARRTTIMMVVIFSIFSFLLLPFGFVKNEFFPKTDEDNLYISVELPVGTNTQTTEKEGIVIFNSLKNIENVDFITMETGQGFSSEMGIGGASGNNLLYSITLDKKRNRSASEIAQQIREKYKSYTKGKISVNEVSGGPPAGADVQIKLFGPDLSVLDGYADKIQSYLAQQKNITNVDKSIKPGTSKFVFVPDNTKLAQNNLTSADLGLWLRIFASGIEADQLKFQGETDLTEDITLRLGASTQNAEDLTRINIPTQTGPVPLAALGKVELKTNPTLITREDGKRTLSVTGSITGGGNATEANKKLQEFADSLNLPQGYGWATGGANEENQKSVNSILQAMIYSFLLIILTLVLQFASFRRALIVMLVIPLSITGVFIIFALTQTPLSFPALIGILALFGIVVKNSILIVDKILTNQKNGMRFNESIIEASTSRLEPIALTSIATIVGLTPITLSDPLWRGLGGSIIAGLTFSGLIMLFFIPVVYATIYGRYQKKV